MVSVASARRPASRKTTHDAAGTLRQFIEAAGSGELMAVTPHNIAVVRCEQ